MGLVGTVERGLADRPVSGIFEIHGNTLTPRRAETWRHIINWGVMRMFIDDKVTKKTKKAGVGDDKPK